MSTYPPSYGQGQLVVMLRKPVGAMGMISPAVTINGYSAPAQWGPNPYPITPGQHQVRVWAKYLFDYGAAEQVVDIAPGQSVEVHYSPPMLTFLRGRIGFAPQPRPGVVPLVVFLGAVVLLIVLGIVAAILGG